MDIVRKIVYHYTNLDVFFKMLDGIQDNQFVFYASRVYELNDTTELLYGLEKIWKWLPQIERILSINDDKYKLSKLGEWTSDNHFYPSEIVSEELKHTPNNTFVISLSNDKDSLPMWNMYGSNGTGVALGFNLQLDFKENNSNISNWTALDGNIFSLKVSYGNFTFKDPALQYTKILYSKYYDQVRNISDTKKILNSQLNLLDEIAFTSALLLKHSSFNFEKESRYFNNTNNLNIIKFRTNSKGNVIPYVEVPIPLSLLKKIVVGPCCNASQVKKTIDLKFQQIGKENIKIEKSKVPYRDF